MLKNCRCPGKNEIVLTSFCCVLPHSTDERSLSLQDFVPQITWNPCCRSERPAEITDSFPLISFFFLFGEGGCSGDGSTSSRSPGAAAAAGGDSFRSSFQGTNWNQLRILIDVQNDTVTGRKTLGLSRTPLYLGLVTAANRNTQRSPQLCKYM